MTYDYANARIRGMRGRLLRARELEALAALGGVPALIAALGRTDHAADMEAIGAVGPPSVLTVDEVVRRNTQRHVRGLRSLFAEGSAERRLVRAFLMRYDLENAVAVIRGKAAGAAQPEITGTLLAVGALDEGRLAELAAATDLARCADLLRRWGLPFSAGLASALPGFRDRGRLPEVETAMRRGMAAWLSETLDVRDPNARLVLDAYALEAEALPVLVDARLAARGRGPGERFPRDGAPRHAALARGIARAVAEADPTVELDDAVRAERAVLAYRVRWARAHMLREPLGIATLVCYVYEKEHEARALRLIARQRYA